jgi:hypothetical protein
VRVACLAEKPAGLYFATAMSCDAAHEIVVAGAIALYAFAWGVVLADETLAILRQISRRQQADDQRAAPRLGLAQLQPRAVRDHAEPNGP